MDVQFNTNKLSKLCTNEYECQKKYSDKIVFRKIYQRLLELRAARSLKEMFLLPSARCHRLIGDRKGQFAVNLTGKLRMIFVSTTEPPPLDKSGGLDIARVDAVKIVEIVDYH